MKRTDATDSAPISRLHFAAVTAVWSGTPHAAKDTPSRADAANASSRRALKSISLSASDATSRFSSMTSITVVTPLVSAVRSPRLGVQPAWADDASDFT